MKRTHQAIFLAIMMATMSLAGCFGGDDEGSDEDNTAVETLDDWQVHFANSASDLPECNDDRNGWLYYVSADENFRVCTQFGWELVDITGPPGIDGMNGIDGQDGSSILINVVNSTACLNGGNTFEIGGDNDADGVLSVTEVKITVDICNGAQGPEGPQGPAGANGTNGTNGQDGPVGLNALVSMTPVSIGSNCTNGGSRIDVGVDDNSNGILETSEIDQTQYVCDGGSSNNTMLTMISSPHAHMGCDAGGRIVSHGLDNGDGGGTHTNGILETGEIDSSTTFCSRFFSDDYNLRMVKDIYSTSAGPYLLTSVGSTLFFTAEAGTDGSELWKSDGTSSGTVMVKDINVGSNGSSPAYLTAVGDTLFFTADDGINGNELWKSDGTSSGTVMVKDIVNGSSGIYADSFAAVGNTLYFNAYTGANGYELWKSDGTSSGTVMVKDIFNTVPIDELTAIGNTLFFKADDGTHGYELWKSDGTASGTVMVKDIYSGSYDSLRSYSHSLIVIGNTLFFKANDGTHGYELWKSDGTASGTVMVKDIHSEYSGDPNYLTVVGNTLYFTASSGTSGTELWKSDGTSSGTVPVHSFNNAYSLTAVGNTLYFSASDGVNGRELWKSDGTTSGTVMVKDINSGSSNSVPSYLTAVGNTLYFKANDGTHGQELWKSDGTSSGTVMVKDINSGSDSGSPYSLTAVGNSLYFGASDGLFNGTELYTNLGIHTEVTYS